MTFKTECLGLKYHNCHLLVTVIPVMAHFIGVKTEARDVKQSVEDIGPWSGLTLKSKPRLLSHEQLEPGAQGGDGANL